jgi:UDP-N-acetylglucosamine acyltransferase
MGTSIGKDVPAFVTVAGSPAVAKTINTEGLRRRGFDASEIAALRRAFKIVYRQGLTLEVALDRLQLMVEDTPSIQMLIDSLRQSQRGIVR